MADTSNLEARLWAAADQLRANSRLKAGDAGAQFICAGHGVEAWALPNKEVFE
jgi:hypothetical protein